MFLGMGDRVESEDTGRDGVSLRQHGLRIVRGLSGSERDLVLACWIELWRGAVHSHREFMAVDAARVGDTLLWSIRPD